ncbi:MAG: VOC family protein [Pyrinomonadaceae bacterium]|nr:VOC family protein [Pyrinomonadaceae bacterium]
MQLHPYLTFNGDCEAAFRFYEQCLGGKIEAMRTHAGTPAEAHVPTEWRDKILHASLIIGDQVLLASDAPPGSYEKPRGFFVHLQMKGPAEAERIFHALAEDGTVKMPIQQTFWALSFGMVVDRFGIPWMVHCERAA